MSVKYPLDFAESALRSGITPGMVKTLLAWISVFSEWLTKDDLETMAASREQECSDAAALIRALARGDVTREELAAVATFIHADAKDIDRVSNEFSKKLGLGDLKLKALN
jgi:hypothetical protein